ncbi:MAG: hypothetical protein C5B49_10295 [Bdellovibrio sp.]|nr:MAG: hypothetical protein C5B49_10295 [Bdellovibrio sp.]
MTKIVGPGSDQSKKYAALSADGITLAVTSELGGTLNLYSRNGNNWSLQGGPFSVTANYEAAAISADGNTVLVSSQIFNRSGSTWTKTTTLSCPNIESFTSALSADGKTAVIDSSTGFCVFTKLGPNWIFTASYSGVPGSTFILSRGLGVAISADGSTIALGIPMDGGCAGAYSCVMGFGSVSIFTRMGASWVQQGSKLVGSDAVGAAGQGMSIALSADGNTLVEEGPCDGNSQATGGGCRTAAWVFVRTGSTWTQQGPKLIGTQDQTTDSGWDVLNINATVSADGNTLAFGAPTNGAGTSWIFTRTNNIWTQKSQLSLNTADATRDPGYFGVGMSLSATGNSLFNGFSGIDIGYIYGQ